MTPAAVREAEFTHIEPGAAGIQVTGLRTTSKGVVLFLRVTDGKQ